MTVKQLSFSSGLDKGTNGSVGDGSNRHPQSSPDVPLPPITGLTYINAGEEDQMVWVASVHRYRIT